MIYHGPGDFSDLAETVRNAALDLRPHLNDIDLIAVTGISGLVVGAPLALAVSKPLLILRKPEDAQAMFRHEEFLGWRPVLGTRTLARALWVDDFVSSGDTKLRMAKKLLDHGARMDMMYLYRDRELKTPGYESVSPPAYESVPF